MKNYLVKTSTLVFAIIIMQFHAFSQTYKIVDTDVSEFYNNSAIINQPQTGEAYYGQDATYSGNQPSYTDNGDETITDNITGLMWQKDMGSKMTFNDASSVAANLNLGGYTDWRVPTIKELYSLILFTGQVKGETAMTMFIDTDYFNQPIGDVLANEREIDAQTWSNTEYVGRTMSNDETVFGVNFVDGRIKGYPKYKPGTTNGNTMYFRMVRSNIDYGKNTYVNNNDGTVTDNATSLMWQQSDDGIFRDWENALSYAENLSLAGYNNWRLPNAKELQSIVDYSRSPQTTNSPAIDPIFSTTEINDPDGNSGQYPFFWTSTSHLDGATPYSHGVYIAFGEAQGKMNNKLMDVHGAGAQRSDPKSGNANDYPAFFGPQGDVRYVYNAVRCVKDYSIINGLIDNKEKQYTIDVYPNPAYGFISISTNIISKNYSLKIYNNIGQIVYSNNYNSNQDIQINTNNLKSGIYSIKIETEKYIYTKKFIK